jgi:hypothetical protein
MNYLVQVYYSKMQLVANIHFDVFSEAEDFFVQHIEQSNQEPIEIWLKLKAGLSEEYLLNHHSLR